MVLELGPSLRERGQERQHSQRLKERVRDVERVTSGSAHIEKLKAAFEGARRCGA